MEEKILTLNDIIPAKFHWSAGTLIRKAIQKHTATTDETKAFVDWWNSEFNEDQLYYLEGFDDED